MSDTIAAVMTFGVILALAAVVVALAFEFFFGEDE